MCLDLFGRLALLATLLATPLAAQLAAVLVLIDRDDAELVE